MRDYFINDSVFAADHFLTGYWFERFNINGYPILGMIWNLLLLIVPYIAWKLLEHEYRNGKLKNFRGLLVGGMIFFIWLIFIPNTAYIITDARHVASACTLDDPNRVCAETFLYIPFFFSYASIGWIAMVYFLEDMAGLIENIFIKKIGIYFRAVMIPLISLGVLLGLLNRWNSWELFTSPDKIFLTITYYFTNPVYLTNWAGLTVMLYILHWTGRRIFKRN